MTSMRSFSTVGLALAFSVIAGAAFSQSNSPAPSAIGELTKPAKRIPFRDVILATTHHRVIEFDTNNPSHADLRAKIERAAALAGARARTNGLSAARANEAGNHIEPIVRAALRECGLTARVPVTTAGDAQSTGYPDIEIASNPPCYLELKTYNASTVNTTQRSFYFSPSEHPKVTHDALHFLLAYQLEKSEAGGLAVFVPVHWKLVTLENLEVDLKFEFNQSNRGLYGKDASTLLMGEGDLK